MRAGRMVGAACACALATAALVGGCGPLGQSEEEKRAQQERRQRAVTTALDAGCREAMRMFTPRKRKIPSITTTKRLRRQARLGGRRFAARTRRTGTELIALAPRLAAVRGLEGAYDARRDAAAKAVKTLGEEYTSLFAALNSTGGYDRDRARVARLRKHVRALRMAGRKLGARRCTLRAARWIDPVLAQRYTFAFGRLGGRIVRSARRAFKEMPATPAGYSAGLGKLERVLGRGRRHMRLLVPPSRVASHHRRYVSDLAKIRGRVLELKRLTDQGSYGLVLTRAKQFEVAIKFVDRHERQLWDAGFRLVG